MEAYGAFVAFVSQHFEAFLLPFQAKDPMIHLLYHAMLSLPYGLQRKFFRGAKLSSEDLGENIRININTDDDTTFFLKDESVEKVMNVFDTFSICSGLKPNKSQCEIASIGVLKGVSMELSRMEYIDITKTP